MTPEELLNQILDKQDQYASEPKPLEKEIADIEAEMAKIDMDLARLLLAQMKKAKNKYKKVKYLHGLDYIELHCCERPMNCAIPCGAYIGRFYQKDLQEHLSIRTVFTGKKLRMMQECLCEYHLDRKESQERARKSRDRAKEELAKKIGTSGTFEITGGSTIALWGADGKKIEVQIKNPEKLA